MAWVLSGVWFIGLSEIADYLGLEFWVMVWDVVIIGQPRRAALLGLLFVLCGFLTFCAWTWKGWVRIALCCVLNPWVWGGLLSLVMSVPAWTAGDMRAPADEAVRLKWVFLESLDHPALVPKLAALASEKALAIRVVRHWRLSPGTLGGVAAQLCGRHGTRGRGECLPRLFGSASALWSADGWAVWRKWWAEQAGAPTVPLDRWRGRTWDWGVEDSAGYRLAWESRTRFTAFVTADTHYPGKNWEPACRQPECADLLVTAFVERELERGTYVVISSDHVAPERVRAFGGSGQLAYLFGPDVRPGRTVVGWPWDVGCTVVAEIGGRCSASGHGRRLERVDDA